MTKIAHLLFFPGMNLINTMVTASVSSHGGPGGHVTPHTSKGFRCLTPSESLLSSLPTLFPDEK